MKKNKLRIFWLRFWHLRSFLTRRSINGFWVKINWPNKGWEKEAETIKGLFKRYLPKDWVTDGPSFVIGIPGVKVIYAWPKDDVRVQYIPCYPESK